MEPLPKGLTTHREMFSLFGTGRGNAYAQQCAAIFFMNALFGDNTWSGEPSRITKNDTMWYMSRKHPNISYEDADQYWQTFCLPLLSAKSWDKVKFSPTSPDKYWELFARQHSLGLIEGRGNGSSGGVGHYRLDDPWWTIEVKPHEITSVELYVVVCLLRLQFEQPYAIEKLFQYKEKGLSVSDCWLLSIFGSPAGHHHFLATTMIMDCLDPKKWDLPLFIQQAIDNKLPLGERNRTIEEGGKSMLNLISYLTRYYKEVQEDPKKISYTSFTEGQIYAILSSR